MSRKGKQVLGAFVDALSWNDAVRQIVVWGAARESRYVCMCNAHSVVTATLDPEFEAALNQADMAAPDGAPVAWSLRMLGFPSQQRINGPDLMWRYLAEAERIGQSVFFYGSTEATLRALNATVAGQFPRLQRAGSYSPSFGPPSALEDEQEVAIINHSGARIVLVGLGCPKQEKWMAAHRGRINAVMIGVGAAFDYHAGTVKRAPPWMQRNGLEWLYRLGTEPRRLLKRYVVSNSLFIFGISKQLIAAALFKNDRTGR
ncbi:WecB/TagA/CpsF family glycosyltransferase [Paraherbaspirillum soli]|uniref:WecB/TagA/CpsF family glycosyltransferase n=1 Tax=Paraherbaspirillum soli TaxID=631222 RepID=A0ABW0MB71_9BURK